MPIHPKEDNDQLTRVRAVICRNSMLNVLVGNKARAYVVQHRFAEYISTGTSDRRVAAVRQSHRVPYAHRAP